MNSVKSMSSTDSSDSVEMVQIIRGQEEWFGSNKSERFEMLKIIGEFVDTIQLRFFLRKDGKIGRIKVSNGRREMCLQKQMWCESVDRTPVYPNQLVAASNLQQRIWGMEHELRRMRSEFDRHRYFQREIHDRIVDHNGIHDRIAELSYLVRKLTSSDPDNYTLRVYWR